MTYSPPTKLFQDGLMPGTIFGIFLFLFFALSGTSCASLSAPERLLVPLTGSEKITPPVVRSRRVDITWSALPESNNPLEKDGEHLFLLNLFDDVELTCRVERIDRHKGGGISLVVSIQGYPSTSSATLSFKDNVLIAAIFLPESQYRVRYSGSGFHIVDEIDPLKFPKESNPVISP